MYFFHFVTDNRRIVPQQPQLPDFSRDRVMFHSACLRSFHRSFTSLEVSILTCYYIFPPYGKFRRNNICQVGLFENPTFSPKKYYIIRRV